MLEWNNNKAFREDYETKVLRSLKERQLSRDGRRRPDKSCCSLEKNIEHYHTWPAQAQSTKALGPKFIGLFGPKT
jgi:hypothetical protein